ncbi:uncharacterized protein LOC135164392 [Diachasmimorpha longicaudata]|uniref:uncharacterized protein LOC135164392 n=1 Tax=Diachasmimorpha longicaudata TaxID=58733 RepID=UPI0030B8881F
MKDSTSASHEPFPGGREIIRQAYLNKGMPQESAEFFIKSIEGSTLKQYEGHLDQWWKFLQAMKCDTFKAEIPMIIKFLTKRFYEGSSYSSLNSARSAISLISNADISNNKSLSRFFKGVHKARPSRARYSSTWDPSVVLDFIEKMTDSRNLMMLSQETATLIALTTGHRLQTLEKINIENIVVSEEHISIKIPERIKMSKRGKPQPDLVIPFFQGNKRLCVASHVIRYLELTRELRGDNKRLFISTKKPHKAVTSQTIGHWIKKLISRAGIDTGIFSAYSTRHAAVSKAFKQGVDLSIIRKTAGWSERSGVFARFYNQPIEPPKETFALSVLKK